MMQGYIMHLHKKSDVVPFDYGELRYCGGIGIEPVKERFSF